MIRAGRGAAWATLLGALVLASGCGPKPIFRSTPADRPPVADAGTPSTKRIEQVSRPWLGTPYRYGGVGRSGIDCSALAQNILGDLGATLPRTVRDQKSVGEPVSIHRMAPGDLVFFQLESTRVNHVGVALDRDRFIHASSSRGVVVDRMMDEYYQRRFIEARRVLGYP